MPLTLEEQERRAYISGDVGLASALGGEDGYLSVESERIEELEHEVRMLKDEVECFETQLVDAWARVDSLEERVYGPGY